MTERKIKENKCKMKTHWLAVGLRARTPSTRCPHQRQILRSLDEQLDRSLCRSLDLVVPKGPVLLSGEHMTMMVLARAFTVPMIALQSS